MQQIITPNPNIPCQPGWCLQYVRQAFNLPARYGTATEAWQKSPSQHRDRNFPAGVDHPVWFSLANEPAGHVALRMSNGTVYSTSDLGSVPHHHLDLSDLMNYYARYGMTLTYLGWTEDVAGYPVISPDGIAAMGETITPAAEEEIDMAAVDTLMAQLEQMVKWEDGRYQDLKGKVEAALDHAARAREVADATENRGDSAKIALLVQMVTNLDASFRFIKVNGGDESLYEVDRGVARGISLAEWLAKGGLEPRYVDKWILDALLPKA